MKKIKKQFEIILFFIVFIYNYNIVVVVFINKPKQLFGQGLIYICHRYSQDLFRKVRSILNKLTPQKFNQLMTQVTELTIDTEERLKGVIDLVFEKAIDEPSFSVAYGNMCRCLATVSHSLRLSL